MNQDAICMTEVQLKATIDAYNAQVSEPVCYVDLGDLRKVSNGCQMRIFADSEQNKQGRLQPLYKEHQSLSPAVIAELQSHINRLREGLENECSGRCNAENNPCWARELLNETPAQSLKAHDDELIERCANVCEEFVDSYEMQKSNANSMNDYNEAHRCIDIINELKSLIQAIRALKGE